MVRFATPRTDERTDRQMISAFHYDLEYRYWLKNLSATPPTDNYMYIKIINMIFNGCIYSNLIKCIHLFIESRNIRDCDGTACGGDSCESGGHCWLDEKLQPHCICPDYAKGDRCEYSETCKLIPCKNNGRCLRSGRCSCPNGWGGFYCEIGK